MTWADTGEKGSSVARRVLSDRVMRLFATMLVLVAGCSDPALTPSAPADAQISDPGPASPDPGPSVGDEEADPGPPEVVEETDAGPETAGDDIATPTGPNTWIRIQDDIENASVIECLPFDSPGADIDAVSVYRGEELVGWATKFVSDIDQDPHGMGAPCDNKFQDAEAALGEPDADLAGGAVSLNGGSIMLQVADGASIIPGDVITVYEVSGLAVGVPEAHLVSIGATGSANAAWIPVGDKLEGGEGSVTVE